MDAMLDALETMVENLRKECYAVFADKDDVKNRVGNVMDKVITLEERVNKNETDFKKVKDQTNANTVDIEMLKKQLESLEKQSNSSLDDILKRLKELENELKNKVNCDVFDN